MLLAQKALDLLGRGVGDPGNGVRCGRDGTGYLRDIAKHAIDLNQVRRQRFDSDAPLLEQRLHLGQRGLQIIDDAVELGDDGARLANGLVNLVHGLVEGVDGGASAANGQGEFDHGPDTCCDKYNQDDLDRLHVASK